MPEGSTDLVRQSGRLSPILARLRVRRAHRLIPARLRSGRVLDVGCGRYPLFLVDSRFRWRVGLDQEPGPRWTELCRDGLDLVVAELGDGVLPVADGSFEAVTMLAVIEHLETDVVPTVLREVRRVLRPGGVFVLTTPPPWSDPILRGLSMVGLSSSTECGDHKAAYSAGRLRELLTDAGFDRGDVRAGYFEVFLNAWACASKR